MKGIELKDLFKEAAQIAEGVPESMREAAFHRALDTLLKTSKGGLHGSRSPKVRPPKGPRVGQGENETQAVSDSRRGSGRPGPKLALQALIQAGFFNVPRTIGDVQTHLQSKRGHKYRATDLSPALVRLLREGILDREQNADGQYQYKSHSRNA